MKLVNKYYVLDVGIYDSIEENIMVFIEIQNTPFYFDEFQKTPFLFEGDKNQY
ncbi:hypothetical protein MS2017_1281 [Bathymodiolus thermophilus thioautotrophic gill symbiont]|uniref:Uncharacterized protein n=1 Tax=Bathymodiolus thermophilus thioautotrophic gill symbiont TaxID=2360 RepID=A0A3G3IMM7_9GAMM|nr:hypothetical protein MS2017_1281 [Bathymodiolus thermophilus thioautotrophic gill symbiont]